MFGSFVEADRRVAEALGGLDVGALVGTEPARALELVCRWERQVAALRTAVAGRVAETRAWSGRGARDEATWLATRTGTTLGEARANLETAERLGARPVLQEAFAAGKLSEAQAREIASTPGGADASLVEAAAREPLRVLRDTCRRLRQAGEDESARYRRQVGARRAVMWRRGDGMGRLEADLPPDRYVRVRAALEAECDRVFGHARRLGRRERPDAYRADALVNLLCGTAGSASGSGSDSDLGAGSGWDSGSDSGSESGSGSAPTDTAEVAPGSGAGSGSGPAPSATTAPASGSGPAPSATTAPASGSGPAPSATTAPASGSGSGSGDPAGSEPARHHDQRRGRGGEFVVLIDLASLRAGGLVEGGTCEVAGVGPIPVPAALELLDDAFVKAVITCGSDPRLVAHFGRHIPETLRTALVVRDRRCVVPGCANTFRQQVHHHEVPHSRGGPLALWNANRPCAGCHDLITHGGYRLEGSPGRYRFYAPDGELVAADAEAAADAPATGRPEAVRGDTDPAGTGSADAALQLQLE